MCSLPPLQRESIEPDRERLRVVLADAAAALKSPRSAFTALPCIFPGDADVGFVEVEWEFEFELEDVEEVEEYVCLR